MRLVSFVTSMVLLLPGSTSWSGPNEGGVLILHANEALIATPGEDFCGRSDLEDCNDADIRVENTDAVVFVLAAFPAEGSPRLAGLTFGVDYDETELGFHDWRDCGDFQLPDGTWPAPGSGTAVTWIEARTSHLVEVYWFVVDLYSSNPTTLDAAEAPTAGNVFADDSIPAVLDPIDDLGKLGFNTDGYLPCPDPPVPARMETWGSLKTRYR